MTEELTTEFFLNLEDVGLGLGLPVSWDDEALRRQVIKALWTLQDRYNLIEVEFYHATDAHITMLPVSRKKGDSPRARYARLGQSPFFPVQGESFTIETNILGPDDKEIPQRLKFLLMVKALLEKEGKDVTLVPQKEIVRRFHIAERTLEKALADLRGFPLSPYHSLRSGTGHARE